MASGLQVFKDTGELVFDSNINTLMSRRLSGVYNFAKDTKYTNVSTYSYYAVYDFSNFIPGFSLKDFYVVISSNSYNPDSFFAEDGKLYVFFNSGSMGSYQWSQLTNIPLTVKIYRI